MAQAKYRGRFVWQELLTEDPAAAATFYTKLLGWHAQPSQIDASYTQFSAATQAVAGMMKLPDDAKSKGAKPMWMAYITVDEVDAAVTQLESLGGKVLRAAMDIPKVGRFAIVSDPQGAVFALFKPDGPPPGAAKAPGPGEFPWMELATTDQEAAFTFYSKLFGWQALQRHDMGPMGTYLIFGSDGVQQGGMFKSGADRERRASLAGLCGGRGCGLGRQRDSGIGWACAQRPDGCAGRRPHRAAHRSARA
jgi:predicted enzyme related to lactoylglutathione lyase